MARDIVRPVFEMSAWPERELIVPFVLPEQDRKHVRSNGREVRVRPEEVWA